MARGNGCMCSCPYSPPFSRLSTPLLSDVPRRPPSGAYEKVTGSPASSVPPSRVL